MSYPTIKILPGEDRRLRGGSPWLFSNELRMDEAARACASGQPGPADGAERQDARRGAVQPAFPDRGAAADSEQGRRDRPRLRRAPGGAGAAAPRAPVRHPASTGWSMRRPTDCPGWSSTGSATRWWSSSTRPAWRQCSRWSSRLWTRWCARARSSRATIRRRASSRACRSRCKASRASCPNGWSSWRMDSTFVADPGGGQKTGWFYDQRDNRRFAAGLAARSGSTRRLQLLRRLRAHRGRGWGYRGDRGRQLGLGARAGGCQRRPAGQSPTGSASSGPRRSPSSTRPPPARRATALSSPIPQPS